jgi:cell division septal protein FtsQ
MERFPQIEDIKMKKDSNGNIIFEIKEKNPFAIWCEDEKCSLVDGKGIFIRDYNNEEEFKNLPKIEKKEWVITPEDKTKVMEYVSKINQILGKNEYFKQQTYASFSDKITLKGDFSCILIFDFNEDISWQLEKMEAILKMEEYINNLSNFEYIDLRFKNQIIIK